MTADAQDRLLYGHLWAQGNILRGHQRAGGIFGIAQDLIDGLAHFRISLLQDTLDHIGRHFLHQVSGIIHIQLVHDLFQLVVGKAPDQQFLSIGLHFHEGLCRQLLGQQAEYQRNLNILQIRKQPCYIAGVHG